MKKNWYGFNHEGVNERFEGGLTYLNDFCVNDEYFPVAVYKVDNPNREKGHKDYVLLLKQNKHAIIRGMDQHEIDKWKYQVAIQCKLCNDVIYSVNRHDFRFCSCNEVAIDGGKDYTKITGDNYILGQINLLTDEFI